MMQKVVSFDNFARVCKHFTSAYNVNNRYGCTHRKQDETDPDENGIERGKCYCHSCPLGLLPDEEDFENPEVDWDGISREDCTSSIDGSFSPDGEYLMITTGEDASEEETQALAAYEAYMNRYNY